MYSRIAFITGLVLALAIAPSGASAQRLDAGRYVEKFDQVYKDYCGVDGVAVRDIGTLDVRFQYTSRGRDRLGYYQEHLIETGRMTLVGSSAFVTYRQVTNGKDLHVHDNGDGTWTIVTFGTGAYTIYGADGKAIARNPGQFRGRILIDYGGTPYDFSDDEFIRPLGVIKESTGRNDDICAITLSAFGIEAP
jgi:hypothetical protein